MRIAQVAPLYESVPPRLYGGTERVVSYLTEELVRQGHEVTLFASGDSETSARLVAGCPRALWQEPACRDPLLHHVRLVELVAREAGRFDLIHFHLDYVHFPAIGRLPCPTVTTLHGRLHPPDELALFEAYPNIPLVSISDDQRRPIPHANWQATVYHGMPLDLQTFREGPGSYLAFLGRMSPEKGLDKAVEIARLAGMPLRVAARIYPEERPYFERSIEPLLRASPWVEFVGEVGGASKDAFLRNASALLFPIEWAEPFGLVMIEAMACGTPVVTFRRGSVPEIMADGVTGFVVDGVPGAVEAVGRVAGLDRRACRQAFVARFGADRMASDYLAVYRRLAPAGRPPQQGPRPAPPGGARPGRSTTGTGCSGRSVPPRSRPRGPDMSRDVDPRGPARPPDGDPHHILAPSVTADDRTRVLKHGDTFAVFDHLGHIRPGGLGEQGLYHEGTRYLSRLVLELDGWPPFFPGPPSGMRTTSSRSPSRTRIGSATDGSRSRSGR